ncbi:hypothetical protein OG338_18455 [Streptomyces sp. NBC_00726]
MSRWSSTAAPPGGRLHPEIGSVRDWSRTGDAVADIRARRVRGNAVLTVG